MTWNMHAKAHVWRPEGSFVELAFSFHHYVGSRVKPDHQSFAANAIGLVISPAPYIYI